MKKKFFKQPQVSEIKKKELVKIPDTVNNLADIAELKPEEYIIIPKLTPAHLRDVKAFLKRGPEVKPKRFYSLDDAVKNRQLPVELRKTAFNELDGRRMSGYSFKPFGIDKTKRKVHLVECFEGARLFAYAHQTSANNITIEAFVDDKHVAESGGDAVVRVPSRTKKKPNYKIAISPIPIIDNDAQHKLSLEISTTHNCDYKKYNIRHKVDDKRDSPRIIAFCAHDIAAYLKVIEFCKNETGNTIPYLQCQFAIPTQFAVDFYKNLENNVLVKDKGLRNINRAEKEICLWELVRKHDYDKVFNPEKEIRKNKEIKNYNWDVN